MSDQPAKPKLKAPNTPTTYSPEIVEQITARLSTGETMEDICRSEGMPSSRAVRNWIAEREDVASAIAHARAVGFDAIAARTRHTARGKGVEEGGDSTGDVQRDKLIIWTDMQLLAKWDPRRYGDRIAHVGGGPGDAPIRHEFGSMSDEELDNRIAAALAKMTDAEAADDPASDA